MTTCPDVTTWPDVALAVIAAVVAIALFGIAAWAFVRG